MMARNPGSSDTTETTSKSGRRGFSLRPLHGPGTSQHAPLPDEPRRRPQASAETTTNPAGRAHQAAARLPSWLHRLGSYGLALLLVTIGVIMRAALTPLTGPDLPTYITFYPLVMLAALVGGWGPGLLATLVTVVVVDYWLLPPPGFKIASSADAVSLAFFAIAGVFMSIVAELYRRLRDHLEELVLLRTTALSQANEQLQTQAEELANANAALHESEQRLSLAQQVAHVGTFDWDIRTGVNVWTPELEGMYGLPPGGFAKTQGAWEQLVHPDDRVEALRLVDQAFETSVPTEGEWRVLWPDGSVHWLSGRWQVFRDESGTPLHMTGVNIDITDRKQAEEALRQQAQLLHLSYDAIIVWRKDGGIEHWNRGAEQLYGYTGNEVLGRVTHKLLKTIHPVPWPEIETAMREHGQWEGELRHFAKDGHEVTVSARHQLVLGTDGIERILETNRDITDRKQAEEALRESEDKFKAIFNRAALGLAISDSTGLILDCNSAYQEMLGYRKDELQKKRFLDITHPDDIGKNRDLQQQLNDGLIDTYQLEKRYLRQDGQVVWCNLVASAIRSPDGTLKYNMAVAEDITRRKHAEEALRASEASLAKAQAIAHLANWEVDVRTNIVRGSQELYHLFDLEPHVTLDTYVEKFHPEDRPKVVESIRAAIDEGKPYSIDYRIIPRPGVVRYVHAEGEVTRDDNGRPLTFFGTVQDVTEHKRAEELLRESEERFRTMADGSPNPIWVTNAAGERIFANRQYREYFGVSADEIEGGQWKPFVQPDDAPAYVDSFLSSLQEHRSFFAEARVKRADGRWRWVESHAEPRFSGEGEFLGFVGITQDIMERKEAEAALKESEEKYRRIVETATEGIAMADAEARIIFVNDRWSEIFDYSSEEAAHITLFDMVFPEDAARMNGRWKSRKRGQKERYEFRFRRKDGRPVWILSSVTPRFGPEGEFLGTLVLNTDITDRKQAEEALREWNTTLESRVAERTAELEHRARQLQKLTLELSEAEERERERLAAVLHDDLQQILAAAKFQVSLLTGGTRNPAPSQETLGRVKEMLADAIEKSRHLSHELSPAVLRQGGLVETFDWLAEQMQAQHGLTVRVEARGPVQARSDAVKTLMYRSAQEMLFNVVKHARVKEARLRVRRRGRYLCLSVSDRGRGFDPQEIGKTTGFGLLSIRERVALLGGRMKIRSARGRGTTFRIILPDVESSPRI